MNRFTTLLLLLLSFVFMAPLQAQEWEQFDAPKNPVTSIGLMRNLKDNLFVVGYDGLYRSKDGGDHWVRVRNYQPTDGFRLFEVDRVKNRIYFSQSIDTSGHWSLYSSADYGDNWSKIGDVRASVQAFIGDTIYGSQFGPSDPTLMRKWGNNPWEPVNSYPLATAGNMYIVRSNGNDLWVLAKNGVYLSTNAGQSWSQRLALSGLPTSFPLGLSIYMEVNNSEVVITNEVGGEIYYSGDQGDNWEILPWSGKGLHQTGEGLVATDTSGTQLLRFQGGGAANWTTEPLVAEFDLMLDGAAAYNGTSWVLSQRYGVGRKKPGMAQWEVNNGDLSPYGGNSIDYFDGHLFMGTEAQSFSADDGNTWKLNFQNAPFYLYDSKAVWSNGQYHYFLSFGTTLNRVFLARSPRNERFEWNIVSFTPDFTKKVAVFGDTLLAPSLFAPNRLFRSFDKGATWSTINIPFLDRTILASKGKFFLLSNKSIYRSDDTGLTWQIAHTFPHNVDGTNINFYIVHDTILVTDPALDLIYFSTDNGQTFGLLPSPQNPSSNTFSLFHPGDVLLLQMGDGPLYLSKDVGQNWISVPFPPGASGWQDYFHPLYFAHGNNTLFLVNGFRLRLDNKRLATGKAFVDLNNNGQQDLGEQGLNGLIVKADQSSSLAATYNNGNFSMLFGQNADAVSVSNVPANFSAVPASVSIAAGAASIPNISFAVQPQGLVKDAAVNLVAAGAFRAGYENRIFIQLKNVGTVPNSGQVKLVLNPVLSFLSGAPAPNAIIGDTLFWDYDNLQALGALQIQVDLKVAVVVPGTAVKASAALASAQDINLANNLAVLETEVVSSYDPNNKSVSETQIPIDVAETSELIYTIRFQNLGNIATDFITVRDTLSSALDPSSVRVLTTSHPFTWRIEDGNILVFRFNPINLSPADVDSLQSQGFIQFIAGLKPGLQVGAEIANTAHIYFDFNPAIVTNTVATSITVVSTFEPKQERLPLIAFPNPANQAVTLKLPLGASEGGGHLEIFSVEGKVVYVEAAVGNLKTIDLQSIATGAYWCRWVSGNTAYWAKIVVSH